MTSWSLIERQHDRDLLVKKEDSHSWSHLLQEHPDEVKDDWTKICWPGLFSVEVTFLARSAFEETVMKNTSIKSSFNYPSI